MRWRPSRLPQSLKARLLLAYVTAWALTCGLLAAGMLWVTLAQPAFWTDHSTREAAQELAAQVQWDEQGAPKALQLPKELRWFTELVPLDYGYRILDEKGNALLWSSDSVRNAWTNSQISPLLAETHAPVSIQGLAMRLASVPLKHPSVGTARWLEVGLSERVITLFHWGNAVRMGKAFALTAALSVLLLAFAQWIVLRRWLQPLQRLSQQASAIHIEKPGHRLTTSGLTSEFKPLVESFNASLQHLEAGYARQTRFMADTAHELKTPLALLRAQLEMGGYDKHVLLEDVDHLARHIQQLLVLAEVTEPQSYRRSPLDVTEALTQVLDYLKPLVRQQNVQVLTHVQGVPDNLLGDQSALFVLLKNLVENALQFSPRKTCVTISLQRTSVQIADQGPGISAQDMPRLFKRYWRGEQRKHLGAGLGLSICHEVARAHGWRIGVQSRASRTEFTVHFGDAEPTARAAATSTIGSTHKTAASFADTTCGEQYAPGALIAGTMPSHIGSSANDYSTKAPSP